MATRADDEDGLARQPPHRATDEPDAAPAVPPAAPNAAPPAPPAAAAPVAPEHVLLETSPPPPPPPPPSKWKEGDKVIARWHLGCHYPGTIDAVKGNGVYAVAFDDGDYDENVIENHIRAAAPRPRTSRLRPAAPAPAPVPPLPPPGSRITVRFSDGIDYGGTITELVDEHHARVLYDDGQSETVRFPDPDVRVLRAAPADRRRGDARRSACARPAAARLFVVEKMQTRLV